MPLAPVTQPVRGRRPGRRNRLSRAAGVALAAALAVGLSGCGSDPAAEAFNAGHDTGFVSDKLTTLEIPVEERGDPVVFGGVTEHGDDFSSEEIAGKVTVVNFWYASCPPCRAEAPYLEEVWQNFQDEEVAFVGVNILDQADTAKSFAETFEITYPSLIDATSGEAKLAFAQVTPIQAPPTTLVLDKQGRVAARILGAITSPSILSTLVKEALAESM